jgi:hypothetical protein
VHTHLKPIPGVGTLFTTTMELVLFICNKKLTRITSFCK